MADDALTILLKGAKLSDAQRAGLWDLYQTSKNEDDLAGRLKSMELPSDIKADLWDLKAKSAPSSQPVAAKIEPSAGYWEDRGIAGKVWHPASGVSERNRTDVQVLGLPPEMAALGVGAIGRAVVAPGLSAAGRVAAGASAAAGQAAPIVKYEVARQGLKYAGLPEPFASIGAVLFAARGSRGTTVSEEAPVAAETAAIPKGSPIESSLDLTRRLRAEHQAATGVTKLPAPEAVKQEFKAFFNPGQGVQATAQKLKLNVDEAAEAMKMLAQGKTDKQVESAILSARALIKALGLPSNSTMAEVVKKANESGRMIR